jgi:hypothetical protein
MLPLSGKTFPCTSRRLVSALKRGLGAEGLDARSVEANGGEFPIIDSLLLDLSDASVTRDVRIPPTNPADGVGGIEAGKFELRAEPLYMEKAPFEVRIQASHAVFAFAGKPNHGALVLKDAREGSVSIAAAMKDLEALFHRLAVEAAEKQGAEVLATSVHLENQGPRSLTFRAEATAKMFFMTATLTLSGQLDVDAGLNARFSNLSLTGDGMIIKMASGFVRPKLDRLESRVIPLFAFSLGDLRLRHVEVSATKTLLIRAAFGSS